MFLIFLLSFNTFAENRPYQEVLKELYPKCKLEKKIHYLTQNQIQEIKSKTKKNLASKIKIQYTDSCTKDRIYIDSHIVRTLNQTIVVAFNKGNIKFLEIASFMEPPEYLPPPKWLKAFKSGHVDSLSGATLTENALRNSLNEIKVVDEILQK